jgi:Tol biopolymer transport system component
MHDRRVAVICLALACLSGCPLGTPRDHSRAIGHGDTTIAISPQDDTLVFNAAGTGGRDLYLLNLDNLKVRRITDTPDYEVDPSFSPDGERIVYAAGEPDDRADHLFIMGIDGTSKTQLTSGDVNDCQPCFSPDGSQIVFTRDKTYDWGGLGSNWSESGVICIVGVDGTGERQLTSDDVDAFGPSFSPDGRTVRFFAENGPYSIAADGSHKPKKIGISTDNGTFSIDGNTIVFHNGEFERDCLLFIAGIDGTAKTQITSSGHGCFHPVFANSEQRLYYLVNEWPSGAAGTPKSAIWTVKTNGTDEKQLTDLRLFDSPTTWKPPEVP